MLLCSPASLNVSPILTKRGSRWVSLLTPGLHGLDLDLAHDAMLTGKVLGAKIPSTPSSVRQSGKHIPKAVFGDLEPAVTAEWTAHLSCQLQNQWEALLREKTLRMQVVPCQEQHQSLKPMAFV